MKHWNLHHWGISFLVTLSSGGSGERMCHATSATSGKLKYTHDPQLSLFVSKHTPEPQANEQQTPGGNPSTILMSLREKPVTKTIEINPGQ